MELPYVPFILTIASIVVIFIIGIMLFYASFYKKVDQGKALIRNGLGGIKVKFTGSLVLPVFHKREMMSISVSRVEIERAGKEGLICKDNMRADIKVAFFVRVNKTPEDVLSVAQSLGCAKASEPSSLREFFDAKFSEALKTVGKQFDFVELYNSRERFKQEILNIIGTDLNGYVLDDAAIDYLEQTPVELLNADNILDAEGIKKITELTSDQKILANQIDRDREKTIKQQDVVAKEAILEMEKQLAETEEKQKREVANIKSREEAEIAKVAEEERLKHQKARIQTDEEVAIAEENKQRQVVIALKAKERTEAVESERVEKDRLLELNEKERLVELAKIEKDKAIESEKKAIQDVIRERVMVEKSVVSEEEKIKDTKEIAQAERTKKSALIIAEKSAQEELIMAVKAAEAEKLSSELQAEETLIKAEAARKAAEKEGEAKKVMADAQAVEEATLGLSEARVMKAKAEALEQEGSAEANVMRLKAEAKEREGQADANILASMADAKEKDGEAEANVMKLKYDAEADGVRNKAEAMKALDGVGKEHEEFKLRLNKDKEIELAAIHINKEIAAAQASVVGEALKQAKIDIVGGDGQFFDQITKSITKGKSMDRWVNNSQVLTDVKETFFTGEGDFKERLAEFLGQFNISSEDVKNLSLSALLLKIMPMADDKQKGILNSIYEQAKSAGLADTPAKLLGLV